MFLPINMKIAEILGIGLLFIVAGSNGIEIYDADKIIQRVNSANSTWTAGHNFPKGMTLWYLKSLLGTKLDHKIEFSSEILKSDDSQIPESFDAREKWTRCPSIGHIRDQGDCGSCWAVSAASVFSDRYCIATGQKMKKPLSGAELLACCPNCGQGCEGGNPEFAWEFFKTHGIRTGGDYRSHVGCRPYDIPPCEHFVEGKRMPCSLPHKAKTPECKEKCTNPDYVKPLFLKEDYAKVKSWKNFNSEKEIQKEIMTNGPVQAAFMVFDDFPVYKKGVYQRVSTNQLAGHGVKIIGWGKENNVPYWLISNSWNTDWGDKGFFKILRGKNECGIEERVLAGVPNV